MSDDQCFVEVRAIISEDMATDEEIREFMKPVRQMKDFDPASYDKQVASFIAYKKARLMEEAAEKTIGAVRTKRIIEQLMKMPDDPGVGFGKFRFKPGNQMRNKLEALLDGRAVHGEGVGNNVTVLQAGHHAKLTRGMSRIIREQELPAETLISDEFGLDVMKEIYALADPNYIPVTQNKAAQAVAKSAKQSFEEMRKEYARLGKVIGYVENYSGGRVYDRAKLVTAEMQAKFKEMLLDGSLVDIKKTFRDISADKIPARVDNMLHHILTGTSQDFTKNRSIYFKTAEAEFNFMKAFGASDNWYHNFQHQVHNTSKILGLMEKFGPRYNETFNAIAKWAEPRDDVRPQTRMQHMFNDVSGRYAKQIDNGLARNAQAVRMYLSLTKLGGAFLTAFFPDHVSSAALASSIDGGGLLGNFGKSMNTWFKTMTSKQQREEIAEMMMINQYDILATYTQDASSVMTGNNSLNGKLTRAVSKMFEWTGLQPHSESIRSSVGLMVGRIVQRHSDEAFETLPEQFIRTLTHYGIGADDWNLIRNQAHSVELMDGIRVISPQNILEMAGGLTGPESRKLTASAMKYVAMVNDYARLSTLESSPYSRQMLYWGTMEGTIPGEMLRQVGQFKQAGVNMMRLQRKLSQSLGFGSSAHTGALVMFTLAGFLSYQARELLMKGRTPEWPDTDTPEGRQRAIVLTMESFNRGAGGLLGDTLFAEYNRPSYRTLSGDIMGPTFGVLSKTAQFSAALARGEIDENSHEMARMVRGLTPVVNMWGISGLATEPIFDTMFATLNSRYEPNMRAKLRKRGQKRIVKDIILDE